jgi:hypothetical protein
MVRFHLNPYNWERNTPHLLRHCIRLLLHGTCLIPTLLSRLSSHSRNKESPLHAFCSTPILHHIHLFNIIIIIIIIYLHLSNKTFLIHSSSHSSFDLSSNSHLDNVQ